MLLCSSEANAWICFASIACAARVSAFVLDY
jgi:hypothetical protein